MLNRQSEINKTYIVDEAKSVLSLIQTQTVRAHVFLVLESYENGFPTIHFMDFVKPKDKAAGVGEIRIECQSEKNAFSENKTPLICRASNRLMQINLEDKLRAQTWYLDYSQESHLISQITTDAANPKLPFSYGGLGTASGSSSTFFGSEAGHNCFTWAKQMIKEAGQQLNQTSLAEWAQFFVPFPIWHFDLIKHPEDKTAALKPMAIDI